MQPETMAGYVGGRKKLLSQKEKLSQPKPELYGYYNDYCYIYPEVVYA